MPNSPSEQIVEEISQALRSNEGNLGIAFRLFESGITSPTEVANQGGIANSGYSGNLIRSIRSILDGDIPRSPSIAAATGRTIGGLIRVNKFTPDAKLYLQDLRSELDEYAYNSDAIEVENSLLGSESDSLINEVETVGGVYVYTFPTYLRVPAKLDPERFWLKIGMTERVVDMRIADQTRSTAMPEDPFVLRVYRSDQLTNTELEKMFHKMLQAAGHYRTEARHGGKEWYATNLEFLDQIAETLNLRISGNV